MRSSRRGRAGASIAPVVVLVACGGAPERPATAPDLPRGQTVYETRCAPCHGASGGGDGPAAAGLEPKPRNFRDPAFWKGRTVEQLRLVVEQGKPGTLMAPFEGILSEREIDDVLAYVQTFRPAGS
jgi:high-affinity iron transporter